MNQPRAQVASSHPAQYMLSSQNVQQMAPAQAIQQHIAQIQVGQYVAPSQYGQYTASSQPVQDMAAMQTDQQLADSWHPAQHVAPSQYGQYLASSHPAQPVAQSQFQEHTETSQLSRLSSQTIVAPKVVSMKRKAWTNPESDGPKAKKTKTAALKVGDIPTASSRPKKVSRKQKYTAIASALDDELPDYTRVTLSFSSRDAAAAAAAHKLANQLTGYFYSPKKDHSIPQTDAQRLSIVQNLFGAMKDVSRANDIDSPVVQSRWGAGSDKKYDDVDVEATCWEIVTLAERLHREGPSALSIRDPNYVPHIKSCADLTFVQRMRVITTIAFQWKARCDGLIKGDTIQTLVAAPLEALQSARNNWKANKERTTLYKFAKDHEDGPKKTAPKTPAPKKPALKSKIDKMTVSKPPSQQVSETGSSHPASSDYFGEFGSS
jgi:hypothetical protein